MNSGTEALVVLQQEVVDIVLTDIKMPGMDGFELLHVLRQRYSELADRTVFVSGDTLSPATQTRLAQSGVPFIEKPFAIYQLEQLIRTILARRSLPHAE